MNRFLDYLSYLQYLAYVLPFLFIYLSHKYKVKLERMKGTGKVPVIIGAQQKQTLFFWLAVFSALIILVFQLPLFAQPPEAGW